MAVTTSMFESIESFRTREMSKSKNPRDITFEEQKTIEPKLPNGPVVVNGRVLTIMNPHGRMVEMDHNAPIEHPRKRTIELLSRRMR
jgi:hypothetical protein